MNPCRWVNFRVGEKGTLLSMREDQRLFVPPRPSCPSGRGVARWFCAPQRVRGEGERSAASHLDGLQGRRHRAFPLGLVRSSFCSVDVVVDLLLSSFCVVLREWPNFSPSVSHNGRLMGVRCDSTSVCPPDASIRRRCTWLYVSQIDIAGGISVTPRL